MDTTNLSKRTLRTSMSKAIESSVLREAELADAPLLDGSTMVDDPATRPPCPECSTDTGT